MIQRYKPGWAGYPVMLCANDGGFVKYEDHKGELAEARRAYGRLEVAWKNEREAARRWYREANDRDKS